MIGDVVGYCLISKTAIGQSPIDLSAFRGIPCRAFEINHRSKSVLVIDPQARGLAMFHFDQVDRMFECLTFSGLLIPPGMNSMDAMLYVGRVFSYPQNKERNMDFIRQMVVAQSLAKGEFCDSLYFNFSK